MSESKQAESVKRVLSGVDSRSWNLLSESEQYGIATEALLRVGFPENAANKTFDGRHKQLENDLRDLALLPIRQVVEPGSLLLSGPTGVGKTCLLAAAARSSFMNYALEVAKLYPDRPAYSMLAWFPVRMRYVRQREFNDACYATVRTDAGYQDHPDTITVTPILVIDEFLDGDVSDFIAGHLRGMIDRRWSMGANTWIATNYKPEDMAKWPGLEMVYSRIADPKWVRYWEVSGKDRRRTA